MKIRLLTGLLLLLFCCCHKSTNNNHNNNNGTFSYSTTYDTLISTYANRSISFSFGVNVLTGDINANPVSYAISSLPANVSVTPASMSVTSFLGGLFTFVIGNVPAGSYPIKFTSNTTATGSLSHNLTLTILPDPDYSTKLAGTYPHAHNYSTPKDTLYNFSCIVSTVTGTPYTIKINNLSIYDTTISLTASLSSTITIPLQTTGTYTTWGRGTYSHDNAPYDTLYMLTIYDTTVHGTDTGVNLIHIQH